MDLGQDVRSVSQPDHPVLGVQGTTVAIRAWGEGGWSQGCCSLNWDVICCYTRPRFSLNHYLYALRAEGSFSCLVALGRWTNTTRWIRGSLPTWLNTPTSSAACWFRRKMRDSWETCEWLLLNLCGLGLAWPVLALQAEKEHLKPFVWYRGCWVTSLDVKLVPLLSSSWALFFL